jgi:hypothetical protein
VRSKEVERKVRELKRLEGKGFRERSLEMKRMAMASCKKKTIIIHLLMLF